MNKSQLQIEVLALICLFGIVAPTSATVIDFESLTPGITSTDPIIFSEATFISSDRFFVIFSAGNTKLCPYSLFVGNCEENVRVDFTAPVNNLSFETSVYNSGDELTVNIYGSTGLLGSSTYTVNPLVDLSSFSSVTSIDLLYTGAGGNGYNYDNFSFDVVPIPAAAWLFGSALLGLGLARRKNA